MKNTQQMLWVLDSVLSNTPDTSSLHVTADGLKKTVIGINMLYADGIKKVADMREHEDIFNADTMNIGLRCRTARAIDAVSRIMQVLFVRFVEQEIANGNIDPDDDHYMWEVEET